MLNSKAFSDVLSKNSDGRLCKRWFIMTTNGTLLAYTQPTDIRELRGKAAIAAMAWSEQSEDRPPTAGSEETGRIAENVPKAGLLRTLTLEDEKSNMIIRKLQTRLLLVLEGGVPPRKRAFEPRTTPEGPSDAPYPNLEGRGLDSVPGSSAPSIAESTTSKANASQKTLLLQRKKLDALASAIACSLEQTGFKMPEKTEPILF